MEKSKTRIIPVFDGVSRNIAIPDRVWVDHCYLSYTSEVLLTQPPVIKNIIYMSMGVYFIL